MIKLSGLLNRAVQVCIMIQEKITCNLPRGMIWCGEVCGGSEMGSSNQANCV